MKPASGKCSPAKLFDHFKSTSIKQVLHFNPTSLADSVAPKELFGNLPEFVRELQKISNNFPINQEVLSIDEIQKHHQLKSGEASNELILS